jgi:large subunit ribosomal protein L29
MASSQEIRQLTADELRRRANELRETLFNLRVKHRMGGLASSADIGKNRKDLARILTVLGEKERAGSAAPALEKK